MALNGFDPFASIRQLHQMMNPLGDIHRMFLPADTLVPQMPDLTGIVPDVSNAVSALQDAMSVVTQVAGSLQTPVVPDIMSMTMQLADSMRMPVLPDTMSMAMQLAGSVRMPVLPDTMSMAMQLAGSVHMPVLPDIALWAPVVPDLRNLNLLTTFNITSMLQTTTAAIARLAAPWTLFSDLENWRDVLKRARRHVPRSWRQVLAAKRAIEQGDLRQVEDFTIGLLGLTRDDIGYLYESMVTDPWEDSDNPVGYLRKATRWRRTRDESTGSRPWLLPEAALTTEHGAPMASPLAHVPAPPQGLYPGMQVDLMRVAEALNHLPDALALHLVLMEGGTEGDMQVEHGWDRRRLERAKKQRQRALDKLHARWAN